MITTWPSTVTFGGHAEPRPALLVGDTGKLSLRGGKMENGLGYQVFLGSRHDYIDRRFPVIGVGDETEGSFQLELPSRGYEERRHGYVDSGFMADVNNKILESVVFFVVDQ